MVLQFGFLAGSASNGAFAANSYLRKEVQTYLAWILFGGLPVFIFFEPTLNAFQAALWLCRTKFWFANLARMWGKGKGKGKSRRSEDPPGWAKGLTGLLTRDFFLECFTLFRHWCIILRVGKGWCFTGSS